MRAWIRVLLTVFVVCAATPVAAAPARQGAFAPGAVVALRGTPHLWIADEQGVLHWGGDTRGLAGRFVDWGSRAEFGLDQIRAFRRGDPWLSAGLLKSGDPIYFVKWETEWPEPRLLHIQSIADVELFGIDATNYGALVLDEGAWQARFGLSPAALARGTLAPASASSGPPASVAAPGTGPAPTLAVLSQFLIRGREGYERRGWVTGELRNDGPGIAHDPAVTVTFLNSAGGVAATATGTSSLALAPGEVVAYEVDVTEVPVYERLEVRARATQDQPGYARTRSLPVGPATFRLEDVGQGSRVARAAGTVTNPGPDAIEGLIVVAWFLTDSGEIADVTTSDDCCPLQVFGWLRPTTLQPGQRAEYDIRSSLADTLNGWVGSARTVKAAAFARTAAPPGSTPAPTAVPPTATPVPPPTGTLRARLVGPPRGGLVEMESTFEITGANPRAVVRVQVTAKRHFDFSCSPGCVELPPADFGPVDAGTADASGRLVWSGRHPAYRSSHYTFIDSKGATVGVDVGDDLRGGQPTVPNLPR